MVFPCEILPSLCTSLSTSNLSEIMKNVHVFLIKTANSLMSSHPGLPTDNVWWIDSNSYSQEGMFSKQEWSTDAYISLFVTIHYTLFDLLAMLAASTPTLPFLVFGKLWTQHCTPSVPTLFENTSGKCRIMKRHI